MRRREFLGGALALGASSAFPLLSGCSGSAPLPETAGWNAGRVAHLLPAASHDRLLLKASFREPVSSVTLRVGRRAAPGIQSDRQGRFFRFLATGLEPGSEYPLTLEGVGGEALCDPWPLRTFPAPDRMPDRFRLLAYTCAGGSDLFWHPTQGRIFQPLGVRQRLLARALDFAPDAALAIGDHVYWDLQSRPGLAMGRSPQAWWAAGRFDRSLPVLGSDNEAVLLKAAGPQIVDLYGTRFRSTPAFFLQDDHDYFENDEASDTLRTFPTDPFMRHAAAATQRLFYPEFLTGGDLAPQSQQPEGLNAHFGTLRYGKLFEGLLYDCRRYLQSARDGGTTSHFVPRAVERWLGERTLRGDALHGVHVPSTPVLWTAGKWGEWYPDTQDEAGALRSDLDKPWWPRGWLEQHDRLLAMASGRRDRIPLFLSGDLHATAAGRILRSGEHDLSRNPVVSVLSGTPGTAGPGWPSRFRGQPPTPSGVLETETWLDPLEENGFSLLDITPDGIAISFFRWNEAQGIDAIARLEPFETLHLQHRRS